MKNIFGLSENNPKKVEDILSDLSVLATMKYEGKALNSNLIFINPNKGGKLPTCTVQFSSEKHFYGDGGFIKPDLKGIRKELETNSHSSNVYLVVIAPD